MCVIIGSHQRIDTDRFSHAHNFQTVTSKESKELS